MPSQKILLSLLISIFLASCTSDSHQLDKDIVKLAALQAMTAYPFQAETPASHTSAKIILEKAVSWLEKHKISKQKKQERARLQKLLLKIKLEELDQKKAELLSEILYANFQPAFDPIFILVSYTYLDDSTRHRAQSVLRDFFDPEVSGPEITYLTSLTRLKLLQKALANPTLNFFKQPDKLQLLTLISDIRAAQESAREVRMQVKLEEQKSSFLKIHVFHELQYVATIEKTYSELIRGIK